MVTVTVRQWITHPTEAAVAVIEAAFPDIPQAGDRLLLPGTTAQVSCREMSRNSDAIVVWLEKENRAYKGVATTIEKLKAHRLECGWTLEGISQK